MSEDDKKPDTYAMSRALKGLVPPRLETDWLGVDRNGFVAFFAANEHGPIPRLAEPPQTDDALAALRATRLERAAARKTEDAYRGAPVEVSEPIFDLPCLATGEPLHEEPSRDYPQLVIGTDLAIRVAGGEWSARDALTRYGYGLVFPALGQISWNELHAGACEGCRVMDDPTDPRPRSPEALTAAGIYVYAHTGDNRNLPYRRIASPSRPALVHDLEALAVLASRVALDTSFDEQSALPMDALVGCYV